MTLGAPNLGRRGSGHLVAVVVFREARASVSHLPKNRRMTLASFSTKRTMLALNAMLNARSPRTGLALSLALSLLRRAGFLQFCWGGYARGPKDIFAEK